ncbi:MAG TPA: PIN domain-containing protein [Anaeromyxobacteraceae bacterium]|nr:PIN domain-containing protein [Anaeromyxobacteraceae bacterium]
MKLADTSLFIDYERGDALAADRIATLIEAGELAVCAVTRYELTCSQGLPERWREFYDELFEVVPVLPVTSTAAALAADAAVRAAQSIRAKAPDALIAGVALEHDIPVVTADSDFLALGPAVELVRTS